MTDLTQRAAPRLARLTSIEYAQEWDTAYRERHEHPDEYAAFCAPETIDKSIAVAKHAIERMRTNLALDELENERGSRWTVMTRAAKRRYETEHARLVKERARFQREARRKHKETNDNARISQLLDFIEDLAIKHENEGGSLDGLILPPNGPGDPITLSDWLDVREQRRAQREQG